MHDISDLEKLGVVGMFVASEAFSVAKQAQADALGFDPAAVFVEHPIQDRTDAEMRVIAENVFDEIMTQLTK